VGITLVVLMALSLGGCSSSEQSGDVSAAAAASPSTGRQAGGVLGTRVCVYNNSSVVPSVYFTQKDSSGGEGKLQRGSVACADGWSLSPGFDVLGRIEIPGNPARALAIEARNPSLGTPNTRLVEERDGYRWFCAGRTGFDVGERQTWDDGLLAFTVTRLPDQEWKFFSINVYNTSDPSTNGQPRGCPVREEGADSPTQ
jgi:hypothetical protein